MLNHMPLIDFTDDKLNFSKKANDISYFINNFAHYTPYSISINGSWGVGKSTLLNFIESLLDTNKCDIIRFNPWEIQNDTNELILSLFEEINYIIDGKTYSLLKTKIAEYAKKLCVPITKITSNILLKQCGLDETTSSVASDASGTIVESIFKNEKNKPISVQKKELTKDLEEMAIKKKKRIVIIIDEIDRLFPNEVVEIFKIIKSTISFPGLFYVVAFDESPVIDGLTSLGITQPNEYLKKIFQKSFYIASTYQIKTLTEKLLLPEIQSFDDKPWHDLVKLLKIFFMADTSLFISLENKKRNENLHDLYRDIFSDIRKHLENPRYFINLSTFLLDHWYNYYNQIFTDTPEVIENELEAMFLVFILYCIDSKNTDISVLGNRNIKKEDFANLSSLFKDVMRFFSLLFPDKRELIDEKTTNVTRTDHMVRKAIIYLNNYPDLSKIFSI